MSVHENASRNALIIALAALAVLGLAALLLRPPPPSKPDPTRAPVWLKKICYVRGDLWRPWQKIVIHHSAGDVGNLDIIDHYHRTDPNRRYKSAGYHFIIGNGSKSRDGEIEVGLRWHEQKDGAHCLGLNHEAIGICLIGNFEKDDRSPTAAQMRRLVELTACLCLRYDITPDDVLLHRDAGETATVCPGRNFPEAAFRQALAAKIEEYRPAEG